MSGWIADHRKELESNIWLMPPMYHRVWQWLKYSVNHKPVKIPKRSGGFTLIKPGQRATSYRQIAKGVGYYEGLKFKEPNPKTIKAILDFMVSEGMIHVEGNSDGTVITVANWEVYQEKDDKGNDGETLKKHSMDTNNNDKTMNNNDKDLVAEVIDYYKANCKSLPQAAKMTDKRKSNINARINDYGFDKVIEVLDKAEKSDFLNKSKNWLNYDWVFNQNNFVKIVEGNYDNKQSKQKPTYKNVSYIDPCDDVVLED